MYVLAKDKKHYSEEKNLITVLLLGIHVHYTMPLIHNFGIFFKYLILTYKTKGFCIFHRAHVTSIL